MPAGHFAEDGEYLRWLEADLKAASESRANGTGPHWIVAGGHRPYGAITKYHVPLFEKYGVNIYFAGHGHSYARGAPVNGITYVMVGGAGCDEMPLVQEGTTCIATGSNRTCDPGYAVPNGAEEFSTSQMAIGVLKADASVLHWQLLDSATGKVLDDITITSTTAIVV